MKLLIVEDNGFNCILLERCLKKLGHQTLTAKNGLVAVEFLKREEGIDGVICDLFLPDIDGFAVYQECQKILKFNKQSTVNIPPFIMLTASTDPAHFQKAHALGFKAAMSKPFAENELIEALNKIDPAFISQEKRIDKPKMIVVDNTGNNYRHLTELYSDDQYELIWVKAGYRALECIEHEKNIKAVILDYQYADVDVHGFFDLVDQVRDIIPFVSGLPPFVMMMPAEQIKQVSRKIKEEVDLLLPLPMNDLQLKQKLNNLLTGGGEEGFITRRTILVVDDLSFNAVLVKNILKKSSPLITMDYKFITASDGDEALEILKNDYTICIVISDLVMPVLSGIELFKQYQHFANQDEFLKENPYIKPAFVLLSAFLNETVIQDAKELGFVEIFPKPLHPQRLLDKVHAILFGENAVLA